jgi:hypothetical protein
MADQETALSLPACEPETAASEVPSPPLPLPLLLFASEERVAAALSSALASPPPPPLPAEQVSLLPPSLSLPPPLALSAFGGLLGNVKICGGAWSVAPCMVILFFCFFCEEEEGRRGEEEVGRRKSPTLWSQSI